MEGAARLGREKLNWILDFDATLSAKVFFVGPEHSAMLSLHLSQLRGKGSFQTSFIPLLFLGAVMCQTTH